LSRVAAIDCGTNSIRLLITDLPDGPDPAGSGPAAKRDVRRELRIVRLGHRVDATGRLDDAALQRTFEACSEYAQMIAEAGAERIRFCATSATRDASNAQVFIDGVRDRLGVLPEVLTGDTEAALSYTGVVRELPRVADPVLVVDLGGGSTELVTGTGGEVQAAQSLELGSVRLSERHLHSDPPTPAEIDACAADAEQILAGSRVPLSTVRTAVGVAGSVTTIAAHALDLESYDPQRIHHARIGFEQLRSSCAAILGASVAERRRMPFMDPGRADVIGAGAVIVQRILAHLDSADPVLMVSEHDILDGIGWSIT